MPAGIGYGVVGKAAMAAKRMAGRAPGAGVGPRRFAMGPVGKPAMGTLAPPIGLVRHPTIFDPRLGPGRAQLGPIQARRGKSAAKWVAGAGAIGVVGGAVRNNSGRPADRVMGRPTGMYGF